MESKTAKDFIRERKLLHDIVNELSTMKMAMFLGKKKTEDPVCQKLMGDTEEAIKRVESLIQGYRDENSL